MSTYGMKPGELHGHMAEFGHRHKGIVERLLEVGRFQMVVGEAKAILHDNIPAKRRVRTGDIDGNIFLAVFIDLTTKQLDMLTNHRLEVQNGPSREPGTRAQSET